ncbi:vomeronasal type-1 receptor 4-like [Perognathus longimembris pacificus]|uniref:vomeronasal type-1 receptor 4-like n=1 Tax=Perognathus longimembris pacificus TaxID=214514 RepID=UPI002018D9FD|nr:vomeronasal type-1 receptor 4-like [Perognathus longimembris pacificus]
MELDLIEGTICIFLTGHGIIGNISVFLNYIFSFWEGTVKKSIHLILIHLALTNIIMLLSKGMPKTIAAFGLRNFLDSTGCKIIVFLDRVARGHSICTTSLLTVVQAIMISPSTSRWRRLKLRSTWDILLFLLFFWILNSLISMNLLNSIRSSNMNTSQISKNNYYCYFLPGRKEIQWLFFMLMILRDIMFQSVMGGASSYMIFLLHKHHQRVRYLQSPQLLYKTPPEMKAVHSVLLLMLCFLFFYWTECVFSLLLYSSLENNPVVLGIREFLTLGFAILSPFVLILRDGNLAACWSPW